MTEQHQATNCTNNSLAQALMTKHGPLMSGAALWRSLGFRSAAAFRKARSRDQVSVHVFRVPDRRGAYAFTRDVAEWLTDLESQVRT